MMLRAFYHHHYLFLLLRLSNPFCFSISLLTGLLQPPALLFLASPRLSSLLTAYLCSSPSLQAPSGHQQDFGPLVPFLHPLHWSSTYSPQAPGSFQGCRRPDTCCLLQVKHRPGRGHFWSWGSWVSVAHQQQLEVAITGGMQP